MEPGFHSEAQLYHSLGEVGQEWEEGDACWLALFCPRPLQVKMDFEGTKCPTDPIT
jgi:hypothetical protein